MSFMDILTKAEAGGDIHSDVWWVYDKTNQSNDKFEKKVFYKADEELQRWYEYSKSEKDGVIKHNLFRKSFFSGEPKEMGSVQVEKNKKTFINRIDGLEKRLVEILKPKMGVSMNMRDLQNQPYRQLYNLLFNSDERVLVRLKAGIGAREDEAIYFAKKLKGVMEYFAKYGENTKTKNLIGEIRNKLASTSEKMQRYLLEGKGRIKTDISHLFHAKDAVFDEETESWTKLIEYEGRPSIEVLLEIYKSASIPLVKVGNVKDGLKGLQDYYSLDVDEFVEEIYSLITSESEDPVEHFKLFYNEDNVLRMIYRLVPDILHHNQEKMSDSEKEKILTKHFDVLEYLIRINDLTGNYGKLKKVRLNSLKNVAKKREGGTLLRMNRNFPNLETAWDTYQEDPDKYKPESEPRRTKTPSPKKFDAPTVRGTYPKKTKKIEEIFSHITQTVAHTKEELDKLKEERKKRELIWETSQPKNEKGKKEQEREWSAYVQRIIPQMKRTLATIIEKVESVGLIFEDTPESVAQEYSDLAEYKDLTSKNIDDRIKHARRVLNSTSYQQFIEEKNINEEEQQEHLDWVETLETLKKLPKIREQIKGINQIISNEEQSLDDPPSDDTTEESA